MRAYLARLSLYALRVRRKGARAASDEELKGLCAAFDKNSKGGCALSDKTLCAGSRPLVAAQAALRGRAELPPPTE